MQYKWHVKEDARPGHRDGLIEHAHALPLGTGEPRPGYGTKNIADDAYVYSPVAGDGQYRHGSRRCFYDGPVIDLQVDGAESFVTSSGIAHNCRLWGAVESMPCVYGCVPEGGLLSDAEGYWLIGESMRIGGGEHAASVPVEEISKIAAREGIRAELERIRERGQRGERLRMTEAVPAAFRRKG